MIQKKTIILSVILFLASITLLTIPSILPALGVSGNTTTFDVTVSVNGGSPTITYVDAISDSPQEGTTKTINFYFNATHPNGVSNIAETGAVVKINQSGITLTSTGCTATAISGIMNRYNCSITLNYYNLPGKWTINATITDSALHVASNTASEYTNGNTYGIVLKTTTVGFEGVPGELQSMGSKPQYVNNTGNTGFNQINLTGFNMQSGANIIGVGNVTVNTTDGAGAGQAINK